jgi:hypothetical protein
MLVMIETLQPWRGEPLKKTISAKEMAVFDPKRLVKGQKQYEVSVRHPLNIELLWSDEELAAIGLAKAIPFKVEDDTKRIVGGTMRYEMKGNKMYEVFDLEDKPAPAPAEPDLRALVSDLQARLEKLEKA